MNASKRSVRSAILDRQAHADVFELGIAPRFLFLLVGASGIDEEEYELRGRSVIPVFDELFRDLDAGGENAVVVHVTAPFDVPFARFAEQPGEAEKWRLHILLELLGPWRPLPYFVAGFSGKIALALNGLDRELRCFGGAAFGADALPARFVRPHHWPEPLRLYAAPHDPVVNDPKNREVVASLVAAGHAVEIRLPSGGHRLADYATPDALGDAVRVAARMV